MKCFYHNDLDGRCAAWAVHAWVGIYPNADGALRGDFIEINYNKPFPFEIIQPDEQVWIVDYSISPDEMKRLLKITDNVTWIDHHQTAIDKYADFPHEIRGVRQSGEAGCMLTFKYIHWYTARGEGPIDLSASNPRILIPEHVMLVEDWDLWKFRFGDRTREFNAGMSMEDTSPESDIWWKMTGCSKELDQVISNGKVALKYRAQWAKEFMKSWSFPVEFEGHKCIAANLGHCNSSYFDSIDDGYDILMPFIFDGKKWTVSLYSKTVDVSQIAKKYGGGGHKGASGFQCERLPWD
jgi:oligoribonuclease NrnB/cAMP/cGMP phosphodiesterase (DHH superfamily)